MKNLKSNYLYIQSFGGYAAVDFDMDRLSGCFLRKARPAREKSCPLTTFFRPLHLQYEANISIMKNPEDFPENLV